MDEHMRAAFVVSQAACMHAKLAAMQAQNATDVAGGRSLTYRPPDFEALPDDYLLGHNTVVTYLMGQ